MKCSKRKSNGQPCQAQAVAGTDACRVHAGRPLAEQKARGQVVLELRSWGVDDELVDSTQVMLRLLAQSYRRAQRYSGLLEQAYDAAERLRASSVDLYDTNPATLPGVSGGSIADRERASADLERIFNTGGVAALIGHTYSASGGEMGGVFAADEAIRALVELEAAERDRAFRFAKECRAAGLDERLVALAEETGREFAVAMRAVVVALGHDVNDPEVLRVVSTQLRALGAGEVA